jgi:2-isopropylmalate synthase
MTPDDGHASRSQPPEPLAAPGGRPILIYDTTLRDGSQREGISLSCDDKILIARRLDHLGIAFIEGGWPGSNPKDVEFFERALELEWLHSAITAFGSTCRPGLRPEDDPNLLALLDSGARICTIVGKSSPLQVREVLRTNLDENLRIIAESVELLVGHGRRVIYDAEHFFDGLRADPSYALETVGAAAAAGADTVTLCDTNGGSLPWQVAEATATARAALECSIGIHAHDDCGCAVGNSLAAVDAGATLVQGTINGYGERCGNADLCTIMPTLELKMGRRSLPEGRLAELCEVAHLVSEVANLAPDDHAPYVGRSAFAHKGGLHAAATRRHADAYQHVDPESVGNRTRIVVSELAGRGSVLSTVEALGLEVTDPSRVATVLSDIKQLEARGFSFEAAAASVAMMVHRQSPDYSPPFELVDYTTFVEHRQGRGMVTEATVKVRIGDDTVHTAAEGNGPVHALDRALRKALSPFFDAIDRFRLADYKVRILDGGSGTAATVRVLIDTHNERERWSTVGASTNIIEASWQALSDGIEYGLVRETTAGSVSSE